MNDNEIVFSGKIETTDKYMCRQKLSTEIFYRIINVDNQYYFAQEITTGCVFPVHSISSEGLKSDSMSFSTQSYLKYGKNFIFGAVLGDKDKLGEYYFYPDIKGKYTNKPSIDEINNYIEEKSNDKRFIKYIHSLESENKFFCGLDIIKEKIAFVRSKKIIDQEYTSKYDLSSIENLGYDMSLQKKLCNLVGREEEIKKIIKNIAIRRKSIILIGESGVGKTSIIEKLAMDIKNESNKWLKDNIIFNLNTAALVADTKYVGEFEKKLSRLLNFCRNNNHIILFIDEFHTLYGLGRAGDNGIDAINILKPYISNGDIVVIGATTKDEYDKYIACDDAFCRRFENVYIDVPNKDLNIRILDMYINELENKYGLTLSINNRIEVLKYILEITDPKHQRQIDNVIINNPTISKNIIDNAFVEVKYNEKAFVTIDDIVLSIIECDSLSATIRKEEAAKIKRLSAQEKNKANKKVLSII